MGPVWLGSLHRICNHLRVGLNRFARECHRFNRNIRGTFKEGLQFNESHSTIHNNRMVSQNDGGGGGGAEGGGVCLALIRCIYGEEKLEG